MVTQFTGIIYMIEMKTFKNIASRRLMVDSNRFDIVQIILQQKQIPTGYQARTEEMAKKIEIESKKKNRNERLK